MDYSKLINQTAFLRLIMNNIPQFIFWKDKQSIYLGCNQNFADAAGLASPEEIVGKTDHDLPWSKEEADFYIATDQRVMAANQSEINFEEPQTIASGETTWIRTSKVPLNDAEGKVIGILGTYEDITKRKEMELELINNSKSIEAANEKMKKVILELERANMDLEHFSYATFHDIQEPLRIISNFTSLLEKKLAGQLEQEPQQYLDFITSSTIRMSKLTTGMLTYLKLGKDEEAMQSVNLNPIIEEIIANNQSLIQQKAARIHRQLPTQKINCFPQLIGVLLNNLISNGLKFNTSKQPELTINHVAKGNLWCFSIADNGIGISAKYKDLIYLPFKRLNAREDSPGSGIGLSICKRIVTLHGGKIWHKANELGGTTFYFTIWK